MRRVVVPGEGSFVAREGLDAAAIEEALREHRACRDPEGILKRGRFRLVTRVRVRFAAEGTPGGGRLVEAVVKERRLPFRWLLVHRMGVPSRFARVPGIAERLGEAGVSAPRVLAASSRVGGSADYLISEYIRGVSLGALFSSRPGASGERTPAELLRAVGAWARALHDRGVWQRDLKCENVIARSGSGRPGDFVLIDFDGVRFFARPLCLSRRARNLAQLLDLPGGVEAEARWDFLESYVSSGPVLPAEELVARTLAFLEAIRRRRRRRERWKPAERAAAP